MDNSKKDAPKPVSSEIKSLNEAPDAAELTELNEEELARVAGGNKAPVDSCGSFSCTIH